MAVKIEKDTIIGDVLDVAPQAAPLFFAIGKLQRVPPAYRAALLRLFGTFS